MTDGRTPTIASQTPIDDVVPTSVFFAPHNDDETIFAAYTLLEHRPRVVVVLRSDVQEFRYDITAATREAETTAAMFHLGCLWQQWPYLDSDPPWRTIAEEMHRLANTYPRCFAPAVEDGGHEHHDRVGELALRAFGRERVTRYLTYRRGFGKSEGVEVVPEPWMIPLKLRALACYESQITEPTCRPWFVGDLSEWRPA